MTKTLEKRVAELEQRVVALETQPMPKQQRDKSWLDRWTGLYHDDPDFDEAIRLGRTYRERQPKC
jgi:hypothetical protein